MCNEEEKTHLHKAAVTETERTKDGDVWRIGCWSQTELINLHKMLA